MGLIITPEVIADHACVCGENPLWHPDEKRLYWTDAPGFGMYRWEPAVGSRQSAVGQRGKGRGAAAPSPVAGATSSPVKGEERIGTGVRLPGVSERVLEGKYVGGFTFQEDGSLLLFMDKGAIARWKDGKLTYLYESLPGEENAGFNDVIADPAGRVFAGTVGSSPTQRILGHGNLYRLDTDGSIHKVARTVKCSNGLAFTADLKTMCYTDSYAYTIWAFDYDVDTGAISNQRPFITNTPETGYMDGMTIDEEGFIWSARWDDWALYRYTPDGREAMRIKFPAKQMTSVIFGGDDLTDMFLTSAGGHQKPGTGPMAGATFRLNLGIKGREEYRSRIRIVN
ncbi:MAG: SMP-30/gluconolactonase/LRE family protein [SAR202 cluster bacterium]|nr:SMP-30/gluconolactonase/LRE family protein [SAR202 cluster bacterium]